MKKNVLLLLLTVFLSTSSNANPTGYDLKEILWLKNAPSQIYECTNGVKIHLVHKSFKGGPMFIELINRQLGKSIFYELTETESISNVKKYTVNGSAFREMTVTNDYQNLTAQINLFYRTGRATEFSRCFINN